MKGEVLGGRSEKVGGVDGKEVWVLDWVGGRGEDEEMGEDERRGGVGWKRKGDGKKKEWGGKGEVVEGVGVVEVVIEGEGVDVEG